jgi:hypothetical protein
MIVYDPRGMSWDQWCSLMIELFAAQQLSKYPESQWQDWATALQGIGYFNNSAVPGPQGFSDWRGWASAVAGSMSLR